MKARRTKMAITVKSVTAYKVEKDQNRINALEVSVNNLNARIDDVDEKAVDYRWQSLNEIKKLQARFFGLTYAFIAISALLMFWIIMLSLKLAGIV